MNAGIYMDWRFIYLTTRGIFYKNLRKLVKGERGSDNKMEVEKIGVLI